MPINSLSPRLPELEQRFAWLERHEGAFPYDDRVLSQEAILEGSSASLFGRTLDWLGREAFSREEADILARQCWQERPECLLEALAACPTAKGMVVDHLDEAYFYLLATDRAGLRRELLAVLKARAAERTAPAAA